jgi:hypothetical protein
MQDTILFTQLLGLTPPWRVTELNADLENQKITVKIEWPIRAFIVLVFNDKTVKFS